MCIAVIYNLIRTRIRYLDTFFFLKKIYRLNFEEVEIRVSLLKLEKKYRVMKIYTGRGVMARDKVCYEKKSKFEMILIMIIRKFIRVLCNYVKYFLTLLPTEIIQASIRRGTRSVREHLLLSVNNVSTKLLKAIEKVTREYIQTKDREFDGKFTCINYA